VISICGAELPDSLEDLLEEEERVVKRRGKMRAFGCPPKGSDENEVLRD